MKTVFLLVTALIMCTLVPQIMHADGCGGNEVERSTGAIVCDWIPEGDTYVFMCFNGIECVPECDASQDPTNCDASRTHKPVKQHGAPPFIPVPMLLQ